MAKTKISEFDVDPANNTDINNINIAEGCAPSGINNAIRQLMSDLKEFQTGAGGDSITAVGVFSDTVGEKTSGAGVTVDGVLLKDNAVTASGGFSGAVNGTVGATTPNTGAFTTLSASGAFSANGGTTLGDASGDALTINSSAVSIPNGLNFDSNTFVIDATNNRVGIGTDSPSRTLHVAGLAYSSTGGFAVGDGTSFTPSGLNLIPNYGIGHVSSLSTATLAGFGGLNFYTNQLERMRIDQSGNVGIGSSSPSAKLDVVGNVRTTTYYNFNGNGSNPTTVDAAIYDQAFVGPTISGSSITFRTSSTTPAERMRITPTGNVGIGISSPTQKLDVDGNIKINGSANTRGLYWSMYGQTNNAYLDINGAVDGNLLRFGTNNTERIRISGGGELLFNCTGRTGDAPNVAGGRINEVNGNEKVRVTADGLVAFQFYSPSGGTSAPVGNITVNASSVSFVTSSDYRLKENIAPMTGALTKVSALKPCTYTWKSTGKESQGFIAHEIQEVVPDCVSGEKDETKLVDIKDEDGNVTSQEEVPVYQGIDTSFLVATLTAAIQELKAIVDAQATRIEALENK